MNDAFSSYRDIPTRKHTWEMGFAWDLVHNTNGRKIEGRKIKGRKIEGGETEQQICISACLLKYIILNQSLISLEHYSTRVDFILYLYT